MLEINRWRANFTRTLCLCRWLSPPYCLARCVAWKGLPTARPPLARIRSLAYFLPVIAEMQQLPPLHGYLDYLRLKFKNITQAARPDVQKSTLSEDR